MKRYIDNMSYNSSFGVLARAQVGTHYAKPVQILQIVTRMNKTFLLINLLN